MWQGLCLAFLSSLNLLRLHVLHLLESLLEPLLWNPLLCHLELKILLMFEHHKRLVKDPHFHKVLNKSSVSLAPHCILVDECLQDALDMLLIQIAMCSSQVYEKFAYLEDLIVKVVWN